MNFTVILFYDRFNLFCSFIALFLTAMTEEKVILVNEQDEQIGLMPKMEAINVMGSLILQQVKDGCKKRWGL